MTERDPSRPSAAPRAPATGSWTLKRVATKNRQRLGYRRIVQLLVYLIIIPTVLLLGLGITIMFIGQRINLVLGIMTVSFVSVVVTGVVLVLVFVRREANLSELQADFVSKVSHELKTPLTAIRLLAETMERARGDGVTQEKCLTTLIGETERLTGRIERLLDWGRMEAGRKLYDLREESVADIVRESVDAFIPLRMQAEIDFACEVDADVPKVLVDRHAIVDAVVNLLSNAQKYGGTPPTVRLRAYRGPRGYACIEVSDNGAGIPRPEHRRIFDKFYRIDDRLSRAREGSGLGLAIVKHIVRAHRGRIRIDSKVGSGSKFQILLPPWVNKSSRRALPTELDRS
jgi:two-component system phosphate regulon sensor histidine kinase PhoR